MSDEQTAETEIEMLTRADLGIVGLVVGATEGSNEIELTAAHVSLYLAHRNAGLEVVQAAHATTLAAEGEPKLSISPRQARLIEAAAALRHEALSETEPAPVVTLPEKP